MNGPARLVFFAGVGIVIALVAVMLLRRAQHERQLRHTVEAGLHR